MDVLCKLLSVKDDSNRTICLRVDQRLIVLSRQELNTFDSKRWILRVNDVLPCQLSFNTELLDQVVAFIFEVEEVDVLLELLLKDPFTDLIQVVFPVRQLKVDEIPILVFMDELICNLVKAPVSFSVLCDRAILC